MTRTTVYTTLRRCHGYTVQVQCLFWFAFEEGQDKTVVLCCQCCILWSSVWQDPTTCKLMLPCHKQIQSISNTIITKDCCYHYGPFVKYLHTTSMVFHPLHTNKHIRTGTLIHSHSPPVSPSLPPSLVPCQQGPTTSSGPTSPMQFLVLDPTDPDVVQSIEVKPPEPVRWVRVACRWVDVC